MKLVIKIKKKIKNYLLNSEAKNVPVSEKRSYDKIFVIGFNKTGTTSLYITLKELGFNMGNQKVAEVMAYYMFKNNDFSELKPYTQSAEAFQDIPFSLPGIYKKLYLLYPNAKFILTIRDSAAQWYTSLINFHKKRFNKLEGNLPTIDDHMKSNYVFPGYNNFILKNNFNYPETPLYSKLAYVDIYEKHIIDVKAFFKSKKDNLIVINVSKKGERNRLLKFLGVKPNRLLSASFGVHKKTNIS